MEIPLVEFIKSSPDIQSCPGSRYPEYAFAGRSNVGKSSLINMLTGRKNMAKTSSTPGKTRCINHYLINKSWYLVDLPGYGYARTSKAVKNKFPVLIQEYLLHRKSLACLFILLDSRHEPMKNDMEFILWAGKNQIPLVLCFTKSDKITPAQLQRQLGIYRERLHESWEDLPDFVVTSSVARNGRKELLEIIERTNKLMAGA